MPDPPTWVTVDLLDELLDRLFPIADDVARHPFRYRDQVAVHDEHPVIEPEGEGLDQYGTGVLASLLEGDLDVLGIVEIQGDASTVVGVERFDYDGIADAFCGPDGVTRAMHQPLFRNGESEITEDIVRLFLVRRDLHRDVRSLGCHGGLNPLLPAPVAELHHRILVQPEPGDVPFPRRTNEGRGAGSERVALDEANERVALVLPVEVLGEIFDALPCLVGQECEQERSGQSAGGEADLAVVVFVDDVVFALRSGSARPAEGDVLSGHVLELDRDVFQDVPQPRALVLGETADESSGLTIGTPVLPETREGFEEMFDERFPEPERRPGLEGAQVDPESDDRERCVQAWTDVDRAFDEFHGGLGGKHLVVRSLAGVQVEGPSVHEEVDADVHEADGFSLGARVEIGILDVCGIDDRDGATSDDLQYVVGADKGCRIFVQAQSDRERIQAQGRQQTAQSSPFGEVVVYDDSVREPQPRSHRHEAGTWKQALAPEGDHVLRHESSARRGPSDVGSACAGLPEAACDRGATQDR